MTRFLAGEYFRELALLSLRKIRDCTDNMDTLTCPLVSISTGFYLIENWTISTYEVKKTYNSMSKAYKEKQQMVIFIIGSSKRCNV